MIANKKIEDLIRFFHAYHTDVQPAVAAADRRRAERVRAVSGVAAPAGRRRSAPSHVHFVGHVSDEELVAFYDVADLFLCASEHEGFCVPLVEAFYKQVPVLAYAATAVPSTMDGAGVLFDDKDPMHVAALMDAIVSNADAAGRDRRRPARRRSIGCGRRTSPARCSASSIEILAAPARRRRDVAFDFWRQFDAAQELEELRLYRPGDLPGAAGGG